MSLKKRALISVLWNSIGTFGTMGIQFIVMLIMARLLKPSDYGLIGMLSVFIAISQSLIDSGFGQALIRKVHPSKEDYSTVFLFNIVTGLCVYILLYLFAPIIASFYKEPPLVNLSRVYGISFFINSFGIIQKTILIKNMNFKSLSIRNLIATILSAPIGIYLAYTGNGPWALVYQSIANNIFSVILLWNCSSWRPAIAFCKESFLNMFSFGSKLLFSGLLDTIYNNLSSIIIGKMFSAQNLGYYTRANQLQALPIQSISSVVQSVTYPLYSQIQNDDVRLKSGFQKTTKMLLFFILPVCGLLFLISEPFVRIVLTEKWIQSVIYLKLFLLFGWLYPLHAINLNILKVKGRSDLFLQLEIIKKIMVTCSLAISVPFGIVAMIYGQMICSIIAYFINSYYSGKLIGYSWEEQLKDTVSFILSAFAMTFIVNFFTSNIHNDIYAIIIRILLGVSLYLTFTIKTWIIQAKFFFKNNKRKKVYNYGK